MLAYFWALSMSSSYVLYDIWVSLIPIGIPLHTQKQMVQLGSRMLIDWSQFFRDICSRWLIDHSIRLGGVGHVEQIDESLLARRKYNIGHQINEQWIFGILDVHAGIGVIRLVQNRNRATLLPIIEEYVLPGSTNKKCSNSACFLRNYNP